MSPLPVRRYIAKSCNRLSDRQIIMVMAVATGLFAGSAAFLLKRLIAFISTHLVRTLDAGCANWQFLLFPVAGILLTGIYQRHVLHADIYHGVGRLGMAIAHRHYREPFYMIYAPMVASSLTLGFGGSAGSEGPIAVTGAAIGSNIARLCGARPELMRFMLACGAAAGIAGIFKAPVGGALFALEVLSVELSITAVIAVFVASLASYLMAYALSGFTADLAFLLPEPYDASSWPLVLLLGIFCGLYAFYYSRVMRRMVLGFNAMTSPLAKNLISGGLLAVCIFVFPALWGEGYGFIAKVLAGDGHAITAYSFFAGENASASLMLALAGGILLLKPFATASTNSGGGVAGDFAPTLFAGCIAGWFFAMAGNTWFGARLPVCDCALWGMAGVMAGAIQAPLMAIFLVVEMVQGYSMLLPVMAVATTSYIIMKCLGRIFKIHWFYRHKA